jgi:hypothetical protein
LTLNSEDLFTLALFGAVALLLWGLAGMLGLNILKVRRIAAEGAAWPQTEGVVLLSQVLQHRSSDGSGGSSTSYSAQVNYQYTVAGKIHQGDKLDFSQLGMSGRRVAGGHKAALAAAARFPTGGAVSVYYNPANPAEAVLEKKSAGITVMLIGTIILLIGGCAILAIQFPILLR